MIATNLCEYLEWDSNFFDKRIGRIVGQSVSQTEMNLVTAWAHQEKMDCLYYLVNADNAASIHIAEKNNFHFVDIRLTLDRKINTEPDAPRNTDVYTIRPALDADIPTLRTIARDIYADSRFFYDRNFPRDLCRELYAVWIEKSCRGYADHVIVAAQHDRPVGYITCHLATATSPAKIGLFGIDEVAQGQGLGGQLLTCALHWFWQQKMTYITVVTQGRNIAAQRLYQKHGFLTSSVSLWYHNWF